MGDKVILQKDVDSLFDWATIWGSMFNVSKCNILHLATQVTKPVRFYTLGGEVISSISEAKYLGVTLSNNYGTTVEALYLRQSKLGKSASRFSVPESLRFTL